MKGYILFISCFFLTLLQAQDTIPLPLSGTEVNLLVFGDDSCNVLLYNMHDNENTSALAGRVIAQKYMGEYYELIHNGKRNISFLLGEDSIHIDPNRIYTDTGVWLQLQRNKITDTPGGRRPHGIGRDHRPAPYERRSPGKRTTRASGT